METTNTLRSGREDLRRFDSQELRTLCSSLFSGVGLPQGPGGWTTPIDHRLSDNLGLKTAELLKQSRLLSSRWADIYLTSIRQALSQAEAYRREFTELNAKLTTSLIDQLNLDRTEDIHREEIRAGWFTLQWEVSNAELQAQERWNEAAKAVKAVYVKATSDPSYGAVLTDVALAASYRAWLAQASAYTMYWKAHSEQATHAPPENPANYLHALDPFLNPGGVRISAPPTGQISSARPIQNWIWTMSKIAHIPEVISYQTSILSQKESSTGGAESAERLLHSKKTSTAFAKNDINYRRRRSELVFLVNDLKRRALNDPEGPFNYVPRLVGLREKLVSVLTDIIPKAIVASEGISKHWQWPLTLQPPVPEGWDDEKASYIDALRLWVQQCEIDINQWVHREVSSVISLSVRSLAGEARWEAAKKASSAGMFNVNFKVHAKEFAPYLAVRVRGISAFVVGVTDTKHGVWKGSVRSPVMAESLDSVGAVHRIKQEAVLTDLGRIASRANAKPADVVGTVQLRNLSPISDRTIGTQEAEWNIQMLSVSSDGGTISVIKDIQIDLFISAISP